MAYDDPNTYDDTPKYSWGPNFRFEDLSEKINIHNNNLFANLREAIEDLLGDNSPRGRDCKSPILVAIA